VNSTAHFKELVITPIDMSLEGADTTVDLERISLTGANSAEHILNTLDIGFRRQLTEDSQRVSQPVQIKLPLRDHQLAVIHAMHMQEKASLEGIKHGSTKTYCNYGVLGDEVGTGKSLAVLGFIAHMKAQESQTQQSCLMYGSSKTIFTVYTRPAESNAVSNLIVVPHTLYRQWQEYCKKQTTLNVFYAKSAKDIAPLGAYWNLTQDTDISGSTQEKRTNVLKTIQESDVILISNTLYSEFTYFASCNNITLKRIFIDEMDTIHISGNTPPPAARFVWFISATWTNFIMQGTCIRPLLLQYYTTYASQFSPALGEWLKNEIGSTNPMLGQITWMDVRSKRWLGSYTSHHLLRAITLVSCSKAFIEKSRSMPPIYQQVLLCRQPISHKLVSGLVNEKVQKMIYAGNIQGALEELGVVENSAVSLTEAVRKERLQELDRLKKTLEFKRTITYHTALAKEAAIANLEAKIASVETQLKSFEERLATAVESVECPICYEDPKQNAATLTPCCQRLFCGGCILQSLTRVLSCPMCRADIQPKHLMKLVDATKSKSKSKKEEDTKLSKQKQLLKFLKENPNAKVLVFCRYENPFHSLETDCDAEGIAYHTLRGNKDVVAATIKMFEEGQKRVLFLPTESAGAGLNLVSATHIVLLHAMTPEEEKQVIGRAYRLGRTDPLHVLHLQYEGETIGSNAM
jgi:SNF2 family DNA or RNA helicase